MTAYFSSRLAFAARWSLGHLAASALVAFGAALVVFGLWYPSPWRELLGVSSIFLLVVAVDVVCGPLLTLVLASPRKSLRERWLDLSLVALIQIAALAYGLFSVFSARPVLLVFEVDRLVVVTANEVQTEQLPQALDGLRSLPWAGVKAVGLRQPVSTDEYLQSLEQTLQGVTQPMRPAWWVPLEAVKPHLIKRAKPLKDLLQAQPQESDLLESAVAKTGLRMDQLLYLPLTSSKALAWVALISPEGDVVGHAPVDGFD
jgi:hypothetical protein